MSTFEGRLKLQKTVYLLQSFGVYLGYGFTCYMRGPYLTRLTKDGFALQTIYKQVPEGTFAEKNVQKRFAEFLAFMEDKKTDPDRLEILASIHFLKKSIQKYEKSKNSTMC